MWLSDPNDYGTNWKITRDHIRKRDKYTCQACGSSEAGISFHVHHKIPFKSFTSTEKANEFDNLVTLCPDCHRLVEMNIKIKSALSGLKYLMVNLAPLLVLCDITDLGSYVDQNAKFSNLKPVIMIYDSIPAGMGLSNSLYERVFLLLEKCKDLLVQCECQDGCPSCVGPTSESGSGGKKETRYLLDLLLKEGH
jgi:DEAD/DEAH box helicase domain-containing protein